MFRNSHWNRLNLRKSSEFFSHTIFSHLRNFTVELLYQVFNWIFYLVSRFSAKSVGMNCFKSVKYHQNGVYLEYFQHSTLLWTGLCCSCINSFAYLFVAYLSTHLLFCTYSPISNKKSTIVTPNITSQDQTYCFHYFIARNLKTQIS